MLSSFYRLRLQWDGSPMNFGDLSLSNQTSERGKRTMSETTFGILLVIAAIVVAFIGMAVAMAHNDR